MKTKRDEELHDLQVAILKKELDIKDKELEAKVYEMEMRRKILELEFQIKRNELLNIQANKGITIAEAKYISPLAPDKLL